MKKYNLLFIVLFVLISASTFARTTDHKSRINTVFQKTSASTSYCVPVKDTNTVKANVKATSSIILSFKGSINNNISKLHWITEDEHGMKSFTIERSTNNRDFNPIAIMPAMNENGQLFYEYPDPEISKLSAQTFSYRLKITDADNKENYSQVISLTVNNKNAVAAIR
jgi:hypothetical protein